MITKMIQISDVLEYRKQVFLPNTPLYSKGDFLLDVQGHGMEPDYPDGSTVIVSQHEKVDIKDTGIFLLNEKLMIKELGENELVCKNNDFENIPLSESDTVICIGKVIGICNKDDIIF